MKMERVKNLAGHLEYDYSIPKMAYQIFLKCLQNLEFLLLLFCYYFIRYTFEIFNNINPYNLFIIVLFSTTCIRGVGYFNGGFIFCLLEFMYCKNYFK